MQGAQSALQFDSANPLELARNIHRPIKISFLAANKSASLKLAGSSGIPFPKAQGTIILLVFSFMVDLLFYFSLG